jgi:hypothetical protein
MSGAALEVSGGAALAPATARLVPATYRQTQREAAALRDAQSLLELPARATSPASRRRVVRAALALAGHNRWPDVLRLTEDITPRTGSVAPDLLTFVVIPAAINAGLWFAVAHAFFAHRRNRV